MVAAPQTASSHGTPVYITVWDLNPPSTWSSAAHGLFGLGIFHTNLWLPDMSVEWAFGGHGYSNITGIFSLPRDPTTIDTLHDLTQQSCPDFPHPRPSTLDGLSLLGPERIPQPGPTPIPNARYIGAYFLGYAAEPNLKSDSQPVSGSASARWACPQSGKRAFREPDEFAEPYYVSASSVQWKSHPIPPISTSSSDTSESGLAARNTYRRHPRHRGQRLAAVTYVTKTLQALRSDPNWMGPKYDLLSRNCNHFTDMVCMTLLGIHIPAWINRSAMLGRNVVRVLPKHIFEIETGITLEDDFSQLSKDDSSQRTSTDEHSSVQQRLHDEVHSAEHR